MKLNEKKTKILTRSLCAFLACAMVFSLTVLFFEYAKERGVIRGGHLIEEANLRFLRVEETENGISLHFGFLSGTGDDAQPCAVPSFCAELLPEPARLAVTFDALAYDDYVIDGTPSDPSGLFYALFRAQKADGRTTMYFHLSQPVALKAEETDELVLTLTRADDTRETAWFVLSDTYYDYLTGARKDEGFTPTLCDDFASVLMISAPYASEESAQTALQKAPEEEKSVLRVASLAPGALPAYAGSADVAALLSESILSVNGAKTTLPLFYADARFLCWLPDYSGALFARDEDGGERLYVADKSGVRRPLTAQSFSTVVKAHFSADGSLLAFVEQAEDTQLVTLVTVADGTVRVLDGAAFDMPFGSTIMDVALSEDGGKLFCLSGDTIYSLREYDLKENTSVLLDPDVLVEGSIAYLDGYLYYCDVFDEVEAVLRTRTETNEEEVLARGAEFVLSPDGRFLACLSEDYETAVKDLNLTDLATGKEVSVALDVMTDEFFFASDSRSIYFMPQSDDEEFYYQILRYDVAGAETSVMAQSVNAAFFASDKADEIIVCVNRPSGDGVSPVTYLADFSAMKTEED